MINRRNIIVFLAGRLFDNNPKEHFERTLFAKDLSALLWDMGFTVISPHNNNPLIKDCESTKKEDFMNGMLKILSMCDVLAIMPGEEKFADVKHLRELALKQNTPILFLEDLRYELPKKKN